MNRNQVLEDLKDQLEEKIRSSNHPYTCDIAKVRRGGHSPQKVKERPFVGVAFEQESTSRETNSSRLLSVGILIYGYCKTTKFDDYEDYHKLIDEIEYFLLNDYTTNKVTIGSLDGLEGGLGIDTCVFSLPITVDHHKNKNEV